DFSRPLREWLKNNTDAFANELEREARRAHDANEYVTNQEDLLNLTRVDWERARPMVDQMYSNSSAPVSQVLAKWALYRHALSENSIDVDRYRDELIAIVEDKKATAGMRDLAFDALVSEREWTGRDEWYYKLMEDETLADLRVNGSSYTGLTTLIMYSPEDKYVDKMIDMLRSDNQTLRSAAARNLLVVLSPERPQITRAMLPWITDPKWVKLSDYRGRDALINSLATVRMPEAVPALIAALDQKEMRDMRLPVVPPNANAAIRAAIAANAAANAVATAANAAANAATKHVGDGYYGPANTNLGAYQTVSMASYPLRSSAISALGFQGDMRASPALRRMLSVVEDYEKKNVVKALIGCNGFTVDEQVNGLEHIARTAQDASRVSANAANAPRFNYYRDHDTPSLIGAALMETRTVSDQLVDAVYTRIASLEKREPDTADALRRVLAAWDGAAVDALFMRELKNGKDEAIVKLLSRRREILEKIPSAVFELKSGTPAAVGFSACFLESEREYMSILASENNETKAAMLACARLIRGSVPIGNVIPLLQSADKRLALAAEKFLESEDSPQARAAILAMHPGEAMILGATTAFAGTGNSEDSHFLLALFASVNDYFAGRSYFSHEPQETEIEKQLQEEIKNSPDLLGVYAYDLSFIRIYENRAVFSWEEDESRYRERTLEPAEFENFKNYLAQNRVDELPPFLGCGEEFQCGEATELLMLGKNGGRRVFLMASRTPPFFEGLESMIADLKRPPARLRYWLEKTVPGVEILFADDNLNAETVWKNGADLRVLVRDSRQQDDAEKKAEHEIGVLAEESDEPTREGAIRARKIRLAHAYDGYSWFGYSSGKLAGTADQPAEVEFI
ncbi:MAG TPA: hypothetical protein VJL58_05595, partial [Pyrinomonadaceae bacterium]|nr:hypothetical protein [Pyrinomonadaceae bacterium]